MVKTDTLHHESSYAAQLRSTALTRVCMSSALVWTAMFLWATAQVQAQSKEPQNLNDLPSVLQVPDCEVGSPQAGKRVWQSVDSYKDWQLQIAIYLPTDWQAGSQYPVIFEYPGNGGFKNQLGDTSTGEVDGCRLGYGLTGGRGAIWVSLPFVDTTTRSHARLWWGDADETVRFCKAAVKQVCDQWGGDRDRLLLAGFSRGAIACSYIGLRDPEIASYWRAIFAHSHYDGVRRWSYVDSDSESATKRIAHFGKRAQWISHEQSIEATQAFMNRVNLSGENITYQAIPYPNHSPDWLLKDIPVRQAACDWFRSHVVAPARSN